MKLHIDIETYSDKLISKCGVYSYVDSEEFEILLFAYAIDEGEVKVIDLANGDTLPRDVIKAIKSEKVEKYAHNANFERVCLSKYLKTNLEPEAWKCTMVWGASLGLPLSLEAMGQVLNIDKQKLFEGKNLIKLFCVPQQKRDFIGRANKDTNPGEWERFKEYCRRDVEAEMVIAKRLENFPMPDREWELYCVDQRVNDKGVMIDKTLVAHAIECDELNQMKNRQRAYEISGLENPNSPLQLMEWLGSRGVEVETLRKDEVKGIIAQSDGEVKELMELRQEMAKTSVKKYETMKDSVCKDMRIRGLLQFYGANRTGRWAGRLVQVQNLPQNHIADLELARDLLRDGNYEAIELLYPSTSKVLSELIRTAFIPKAKHKFMVADFSAIEARVIAWIAGEKWRLEVFETHGKIYEASAAQMFKVPVESIKKGDPLRQKGKIAELALGYGGGVGALKAMGALNMGLEEEELQPLVDAWRGANRNIVELWSAVGNAAVDVIKNGGKRLVKGLKFSVEKGIMFIELPSGRRLAYVKPRITINRFGGESISYEGLGTGNQWQRIESYGPKLVENIIQAISRDLLGYALINVFKAGFEAVMHVHDEIVAECELEANLEEMCRIMGEVPPWADGLKLRADGYECNFYRKD